MFHDKPSRFPVPRLARCAALLFGMTLALPAQAKLYAQDFDVSTNTLRQRGAQVTEARAFTFRLDNDAFLTERKVGGLEVNFVPTKMKVTTLTVYDTTDNLSQRNFSAVPATITGGGKTFNATHIMRGDTPVTFTAADGNTVSATPVTFRFGDNVELTTDTLYTFTLNWASSNLRPIMLCFGNAATEDATRPDFLLLDGDSTHAPYVAFEGTAFINRFVLSVDENTGASLSDLLGQDMADGKTFADNYDMQDTSVVVNLRPGAELTLDEPLSKASFVAASFAETQPLTSPSTEAIPPTLLFQKGVPMTGPFSLRGGTGEGASGETITGTPMVANVCLSGDTSDWVPKSFMLRTDLRIDCHIPAAAEGSWFKENTLVIASGRRVTLTPSNFIDDDLPALAFEAADSTLVLARQDQEGADIPEKYRALLRDGSGTLYFARSAIIGGDTVGDDAILTVGQNGYAHTFGLLTEDKTLTISVPVVVGDGEGSSGTLRQRTGTLVLDAMTLGRDGAAGGNFLQHAGTATMGAVTFPATGESALFRVGDGEGEAESATVAADSLADGSGAGAVDVEILADGRLEIGTLDLTGSDRHAMTLRGGTLAALANKDAKVEAGTAGMRVVGGGTLDANGGTLTIAAVTGEGDLAARGNVTLETLRNYTGRVEQTGNDGTLTLGQILGASGTVTVGHLGYATDAAALEAVTKAAADYRGTLAFGAANKTYDFSDLRDVTSFPYALAFSNGQSITMRLDQYADATIRWPENPQDITLTLIEAGAYGGVAEIPHVPEGVDVKFYFKRYAGDGSATLVDVGNYTHAPNENGVTDSLSWESPLFTGKGAWIDCEFNGTSANTGWFTLVGRTTSETDPALYNGLLYGGEDTDKHPQKVFSITDSQYDYKDFFVDARLPYTASGAVTLSARPYVALSSLLYPEAWSVAVRFTTPNAANRCLLAIGANVMSDADKAHDNLENFSEANLNTLLLATGTDGNDLRLYYIQGNEGADSAKQVAQAKLSNATEGAYVLSAVCDGTRMVVYLNGAYLADYAPEGGIRLGPGLQVGAMLGGNTLVQENLWATFQPVDAKDGGAIDYLRFYKGALTDTAMAAMANETPHIVRNVRFVRDVPGDSNLWVDHDKKPWTRQTYDGKAWQDAGTYVEPEEGTEVRLRVAGGEHLLQANVKRDVDNCFYSADRTYATLVVEPQEGATAAGTLRIVPYGVEDAGYETASTAWTTDNPWYTLTGTDGAFAYGRLRFSGGAQDPIHDDFTITGFYGAGYLLPADSVGVTGRFDAGVCWFSDLAPFCLKANGDSQPNALTMVAGLSLTRGVEDEAKTWQLTGPITVEGTVPEGVDAVAGNPDATVSQASKDVWVAKANDAAKWTFFDRTQTKDGNADGAKQGLFAQGIQTPGRLYLDLTHDETAAQYGTTQAFSKQRWYRYGYPNAEAGTTLSGVEPMPITEADFAQAVAFQVRLGGDAGLTLDAVPEATVRTFYVEPADTTADAPTLTLRASEGKRLRIAKSVVAAARLNVANGTDAKDTLDLAEGVEIHRGGTDKGAYVVGNQTFGWPLDDCSVPSLEVAEGGTLTFAAAQDLSRHETALVAHRGATLALPGADTPLRAASLTLATGSRFRFGCAVAEGDADEAGVLFDGAVRLVAEGEGAVGATLEGIGAAEGSTVLGRLTANGGIQGPAPAEGEEAWAATATLTVAAGEGSVWRLRTGENDLSNLALAKEGAGTVDFYSATPPTVAGGTDVRAGTLRVGTARILPDDTHSGPAIGHRGLHVAAGATLARTELASETGALACVPSGQTLTGAGTIAGLLRLNRGAVYDATSDEMGMAVDGVVTDTQSGANIEVLLPEGYEADRVFLTALREERTVRRRLLSKVNDTVWSTKGVIDRTSDPKTEYSAIPSGMPSPKYAEGITWDEENNAYVDGVETNLINSYQRYGIADISEATGYTKAKTYGLNAAEISNAYRCFYGVWTFGSSGSETSEREVLDSRVFCMAYEFGISRLSILALQGLEGEVPEDILRDESGRPLYVVVEARVEQRLKEYFEEDIITEGGDQSASFAPNVELRFRTPNEVALPAIELDAFGGDAITSPNAETKAIRWFAIPYSESHFPMGTIAITVHAVAPDGQE